MAPRTVSIVKNHYRFRRRWPNRLDYRDAAVVLEAVERQHATIPIKEWVLQARKIGVQEPPLEVFSLALSRQIFETALGDGFPVTSGTPADKIMQRLVRDGYAEKADTRRR